MHSRPVGWAFIGSGGWVASTFAQAVIDAGQTVVGAFGSGPEGSREFARRFECRSFKSLGELLVDEAVEAVWVASPTDHHGEHALAVWQAGKAVLVEKPLEVDAEAAARLCASVGAQPGQLAATAFQHRFNPSVLTMKQLVDQGSFGNVASVLIHQSVDAPGTPTDWRLDPVRSGGWSITDIGTHLLDIARFLFGDVRFWASRLSAPGLGLGVDDLSVVMLTSGETSIVVRASTGTVGPGSVIEIGGSTGWARIDGFWGGAGTLSGSGISLSKPSPADPYVQQVVAFSAAVRGAEWSGASLEDGRRVTEIVDAARAFNRWRAVSPE